ncbi:MAG TPA: carboxymuconolactone decarboxylase family protein [Streptosporangiaceae bacterium]
MPPQTLELVHLRASQINGCSACVDAGATSATKAGVSPEKLLTLAAWYEDPRFDAAERAALALTEAATRLSDRPGAVTDEIWAEATRYFDERQLEALVLMVAITNFFNRLNTTFGCRPERAGIDAGPAICRMVHLPAWVHRPRWTVSVSGLRRLLRSRGGSSL